MNTGSVRSSDPTRQPARALAMIDVLDEASAESNERIVARAAELAKRLSGELHVASAYTTVAAPHRIERFLPALRVKARDRRRCAIRQLLRRLHIEDATIHVEEGVPQQVKDTLASRLAAVVVGVEKRAAAVRTTAPAHGTHQTESVV